MFLRLVIATVAMLCLVGTAVADVPQLINYQGVLLSGGTPVTTPVSVTFTIYGSESGSDDVWSESRTVSPGSDGSFSIALGEGTTLSDAVFAGSVRWLGIKVDTDLEMTPRVRLVSSPYALRISTIDGADGGSISGDVEIANGNLTLDRAWPNLNLHYGSFESLDFSGKIGCYRDDGYGGSVEKAQIWVDESYDDNALLINPTVPNDVVLGLGGGNVGIGTTNPSAKLDVQGDFKVRRATDGQLTSWLSSSYSKGVMVLYNQGGQSTIEIDADKYDASSQIALKNATGQNTIELMAQDWGDRVGALNLINADGQIRLHISAANDAGTDGSKLEMWNTSGERVIQFVAQRETGFPPLERGWIITEALEITGGSDLSEQFDVGMANGEVSPAAGMVVCIDPGQPGKLRVSDSPYDPKVAGIISGAGDVAPGMLMGQKGSLADGEFPIALTGRVYCLANASNGPIQPGDLLTTSDIPGHAMKVSDHGQANGAIIGKAMTSLAEGKGLVLVLVSLQ